MIYSAYASLAIDPAWVDLLVRLVEAVAWPVTIGFSVFILRRQLIALFGRVTRIGTPVGEVELAQPHQPSELEESSERASEVARRVPAEVVAEVRALTEAATASEANVANLQQANQLLAIQLHYERIYRWIYGTQMRFLEALEGATEPTGPIIVTMLYGGHTEAAGVWALSEDAWVGYLKNNGLVDEVTTPRKGLMITDYGRWFLIYCRALRYTPESRPW